MNQVDLYVDNHYRVVEMQDVGLIDLEEVKSQLLCNYIGETTSDADRKKAERYIEGYVLKEGIYAYVLLSFNYIELSWEVVDSSFGHVGTYEKHNHAIVDYFIDSIRNKAVA